MPGGLKLGLVLLTLGCLAGGGPKSPAPTAFDAEMARDRAERERRSLESRIRLSVYFACGGDREARCEQFAPQDLRGIPPTVPLRSLECRETGTSPRRVRSCAFALGDEGRRAVRCRVTLRELPGHHSLYWSDDLPAPAVSPPSSGPPAIQVPGGPSSLVCTDPLLALTRAPEAAGPAPATPPRARTGLAALITPEDYPRPALAKGEEGTVAMSLRVGPNGRITRCTVTGSSGSQALDQAACRLLRLRARFMPARDSDGGAVTAEVSHVHEWKTRR